MTRKQELSSSSKQRIVPLVDRRMQNDPSAGSTSSADHYRRQAKVLYAINRIFREALDAKTEQQLGEVCLSAAEELTDSRIGFIGGIDGDTLRDIAIRNPGRQACEKLARPEHLRFPQNFKPHGLYGRVVTEGKPLLSNNPARHPDQMGLPAGHPPVEAFLGVPLIQDETVIGLIAVGNRPGGYTLQQQEDLEALAPAVIQAFASKRAESRLKAEQDLLKGIIDNIPVMLCIWNPELERFTFNRELTNVLGWTPADTRDGEFLNKVYPDPDYRQEVIDYMKLLEAGWRDVRCMAKDGTVVDCSWANVQLPDGRCIGIGVDIRQRKQMEEELRKSEVQFKALVGASSDTIYRMSPDWSELRHLEGRMPINNVTLPLRNWAQTYIPPEDQPRVLAAVQEAIRNKSLFELEHRVLREDGTIGWNYSRAVPLLDEDGEVVEWFGMAGDITDRMAAQQSLKEINENLETRVTERTMEVQEKAEQLRKLALQLTQAEQRERKRLARILHDHIQQLLVAARLQLGWIKNGTDPAVMCETVQEVSGVLKEALDGSRSLAVDLSPPVLHDGGLIPALKWLASDIRKKSQFTVHLTTDPDAEPACEETRALLFDCIREMLLNAIKHAGVSQAAVALFRTADQSIRVSISDKGHGFDPDLLENRRTDELTFGLFSCQQRIHQVGGRMEIQAAPEKGSQITLSVPDILPENEWKNTKMPRIKVPRRNDYDRQKGVCRVMIVDDHKIVRDGLAKLLQFESGIQVVGTAADGPTALKRAVRLRPDVLIMDVSIGKFSGIEVTRRILDWNPDTRVIGLSMHEDENIARTLLDAGAFAYLNKSGPSEELIGKIHECLRDLATDSESLL